MLWVGSWGMSLFHDTTYDGMRAHQATILALKNGWNPMLDPVFEQGVGALGQSEGALELRGSIVPGNGFSVNTFHVLGATLFASFRNLESAKVMHLLVAIAAFGLTFRYLRELGVLRPKWIALLFTCNPVVLYQLSSFMLDGYTYSLFQIFFFAVLGILRSPRDGCLWVDACASAVLLGTAKISGASYFIAVVASVIVLGAAYGWLRFGLWDRIRWVLHAGILVLLLHLVFVTYHLSLVAIHGVSLASITSWTMVRDQSLPGLAGIPELANQNKLEQIVWSHASMTHINPGSYGLKLPGAVTASEIQELHAGHGEYRTGGFGPLYSAMLLVALLLVLRNPGVLKTTPMRLYWVFAVMVISISPVWWARWAAYLWMLPLLPLLQVRQVDLGHSLFSLKYLGAGGIALRWVGLANVMIVFIAYGMGRWEISRSIDSVLKSGRKDGALAELHVSTFPSNLMWFMSKGIEVDLIVRDEESLDADEDLIGLPGTSSRLRWKGERSVPPAAKGK
jgi:hypothetical protein